jgi:hypothetical protein
MTNYAIKSFNEELGVGALYGSSEDLDLFIKLVNK